MTESTTDYKAYLRLGAILKLSYVLGNGHGIENLTD